MRPTRWRRSTHVMVGVAVLLLVAAVVVVAALLTTGGQSTSDAQAAKPAPALATANPGIVPVADSAQKPTPDRLALTLAPALADPNLGNLTGRITDAATGAELWAQGADVPMQPASTNKVLTAAAALLTLEREARLATRVMAADQRIAPGVVVLAGGGDPTLSAAAAGQQSWYRDAARISDLADQVRRSGIKVTAVQVDVSAYSGPVMAPGWDPLDIENGDIAPIQPVMLDGGRTQPVSVDSRRSTTPALDAGRALATALGVDPATVIVLPSAFSGDNQIASVQSPPLMERLRAMMSSSDNVMAESIGREVAAALHRPQSFDGAVQSVLSGLKSAKIDTRRATLMDSSGLSVDDRLTAETLDETVDAAAGNDQPALRPLLDLLPIAGGSGTLSDRYLDNDSDRAAAGWLRAKTGSLTGTNALAGIVTDASGRVLTFAFISNNAGPTGRIAIDALAATLRSCGCST
jgi:D-alanyl-D-alanine carboxypeptidase/D-alanyl-D-alanine-endopeptidase (penicillin-binding protein 4)